MTDLAVDASGNIVVVGVCTGESVNFGGGALPLTESWNDVVAKFDADGNYLWSKATSNSTGRGGAVAFDFSGNAVVVESFSDFWSTRVSKLSPTGDWVWRTDVDATIKDVICDPDGNIIVTGYTGGIETPTGGPGNADVYIAKLDGSGSTTWSGTFGGDGNQIANGIASDDAGNIVLAGTFVGTVDFGGGLLVSAGGVDYEYGSDSTLPWGGDMFVTKLDGAGNFLWNRQFGDSDLQVPVDITVNAAGDIALTGGFRGTVDFGNGPHSSVGGAGDVFVVKLDAAGNPLGSGVYGSNADSQCGTGIALDGDGDVIVTGFFTGTITFGTGVLTVATAEGVKFTSDIFLAKLHGP